MMLDLSLYDDVFEPSFLSSTIQYYSAESTETMDRLSITDYLQHVKDRVQQESEYRIATYLDKGTKISLTEAVTNQLLYTKIDIIISQGTPILCKWDGGLSRISSSFVIRLRRYDGSLRTRIPGHSLSLCVFAWIDSKATNSFWGLHKGKTNLQNTNESLNWQTFRNEA